MHHLGVLFNERIRVVAYAIHELWIMAILLGLLFVQFFEIIDLSLRIVVVFIGRAQLPLVGY